MFKHLAMPAAATALGLFLAGSSPYAYADRTVRCASEGYRYNTCSLPTHGYVRLERQISKSACVKGRSWDYNAREIWVDDGCEADFFVETRHHSSGSSDHSDAAKAAAAIAGIAILGAAISAADDKDHHKSDEWRDGRGSEVPRWLRGHFRGYNHTARVDIDMRIEDDGRVRARAGNHDLRGYVNDRRMYVGDAVFEIERLNDGFQTVQVGRWDNRVRYVRR